MYNLLFNVANALTTRSFMGAETSPEITGEYSFLQDIVNAINSALWPILIVVGAAGSIYAVFLGVNMAKAADASAREEAKKRVINVIIALVITVALILLLKLFLSTGQTQGWFGGTAE